MKLRASAAAGCAVGLLLLTRHPLAAQDFECSRDAVAEQVIALASRTADPAALLFAWLRLASRREAAGAPVADTWEAFCLGFVAAERAGAEPGAATSAPPLPPPSAVSPNSEPIRRGTPTAVPVRSGSFLVDVESFTPTSVTLTWPSVTGAEAYDVQTASESGTLMNVRRVYPSGLARTGQLRATVGGLLPGTTYRFNVIAIGTAGNRPGGEFERSLTALQTTPQAVVPTPTSFVPTPLPTLAPLGSG